MSQAHKRGFISLHVHLNAGGLLGCEEMSTRGVLTCTLLVGRFAFPEKHWRLGLPIGQHITLKGTGADGVEVMRPYTPVSDNDLPGFVDFVIKVNHA